MTAKEYREKEQITDANFWDNDEIDFDMVDEFAEDYHKEQLRLHNVSQQRELLSQYNDFVNMQYQGIGLDNTDIDDFLDWLNCG